MLTEKKHHKSKNSFKSGMKPLFSSQFVTAIARASTCVNAALSVVSTSQTCLLNTSNRLTPVQANTTEEGSVSRLKSRVQAVFSRSHCVEGSGDMNTPSEVKKNQ